MSHSPIDARFLRLETELRQQRRDFARLALALDELRAAFRELATAPCQPSPAARRPQALGRHGVCRVIPFRGCGTERAGDELFTRVN